MKTLTSLLLSLLTLTSPNFIFPQQGPGGVGATDGASTLKYWLDAIKERSIIVGLLTVYRMLYVQQFFYHIGT